jgi:hypothetical protein
LSQVGFPGVPQDSNDERRHRRDLASAVNRHNAGKFNATGQVTLTASTSSTTVTDARATTQSYIDFMPTTQSASSEKADGLMYVSTRNNGSFVIAHNNVNISDRSFVYLIIG